MAVVTGNGGGSGAKTVVVGQQQVRSIFIPLFFSLFSFFGNFSFFGLRRHVLGLVRTHGWSSIYLFAICYLFSSSPLVPWSCLFVYLWGRDGARGFVIASVSVSVWVLGVGCWTVGN